MAGEGAVPGWRNRSIDKGVSLEIKRASPEDYPGILQIQAANYVGNLSENERLGGYLSAEYTVEQMAEMAADPTVIVAREGNHILGFLCSSRPDFSQQPPVVTRMIQEFERTHFQGRLMNSYRWFLYGPVCIDRLQRGRGLLRKLYGALIEEVSGKYEVGVAFIADDNEHSFLVHVDGLGMTQVGKVEHRGHNYHILAFSIPANNQR